MENLGSLTEQVSGAELSAEEVLALERFFGDFDFKAAAQRVKNSGNGQDLRGVQLLQRIAQEMVLPPRSAQPTFHSTADSK